METYCGKCRKNTENLNPKIFKTKNGRLIMQSKCPDCGIKICERKKSKRITKQLRNQTTIKWNSIVKCFVLRCIKMNGIVNNFLLVGDKFMPEMHLKQPGFTYSACGPFTKNKERIEKFMQTGNTDFIYKNELDKACFQHDMAYGKSKDLVKRTQWDKVLRDKAFKIASNLKYDGYQRGLASMVYKFFDKKSSGSGVDAEPNYQLASELHRQIIRKCERRKVYSSFRDNIWGVALADMQSLSKYNKRIKYLLCAIDFFSKYASVVPLKDKREISIVNAFQKIISKGRKSNKIWVGQGGDFTTSLLGDFWK